MLLRNFSKISRLHKYKSRFKSKRVYTLELTCELEKSPIRKLIHHCWLLISCVIFKGAAVCFRTQVCVHKLCVQVRLDDRLCLNCKWDLYGLFWSKNWFGCVEVLAVSFEFDVFIGRCYFISFIYVVYVFIFISYFDW